MTEHKPGWAVYLHADKMDLDDLRDLLKQPWNPWVEDDDLLTPPGLMLRSSTWDVLTDPREVSEQAERLIRMLNGAKTLLFEDSKPITLGAIAKFRADGGQDAIIVAATGHLNLTLGRFRGRTSADPPQPTAESELQKWITDADKNDVRAELLLHLGRADNWFDVYKIIELLKKLKGNQQNLKSALGANWSVIDRIRQTADYYRHAPGVKQRPKKPFELADAVVRIRQILPSQI